MEIALHSAVLLNREVADLNVCMHICCAWWWMQEELCERTKMQGELESALELASAAAVMKTQFLANMSHEVGRE